MLILKNKRKTILLHFTNIFAILFLCVTLIGISYTLILFSQAPSLYIAPIETRQVSTVYDNQNQLITHLQKESAPQVTYEQLPDVFIDALLSEEDVRFFVHNGIDIPRLLSAAYTNVISQSYAQGASTLTQQLVKNTMLNSHKTLKRKLEEMYLSYKMEKIYSKKDSSVETVNYIESDKFTSFTCFVDIVMLKEQLQACPEDTITLWYGNENALKLETGNIIQIIALLDDEEE